MIRTIDKSIYTATTVTTGGREGTGTSSDGALDVALSLPGSAAAPTPNSCSRWGTRRASSARCAA